MIRFGLGIALFFAAVFIFKAQEPIWSPLYTLQVEDLDQISLDNREGIFYSDEAGNVYKIMAGGMVANQYSPAIQSRLHQLEAFWTVNIFLFSADAQQCTLLDINLNPISTFSINHDDIGIVRTATLGNNNIFWFFDEVDLSLIRYDYQRNLILQDQPMAWLTGRERIEVLEIKERQNLVFMNVKNQGLYLLDNQGNFLKKYPLQLSQKINVYENHLYYMQEGFIHRLDIFTGKEERFKSPRTSFSNVWVSADRVVFYSPNSINVFAKPDNI